MIPKNKFDMLGWSIYKNYWMLELAWFIIYIMAYFIYQNFYFILGDRVIPNSTYTPTTTIMKSIYY